MSNHKNPESLPFIVCPRCDGHGTTGNPAFDGMSLSVADSFDGDYDERDEFVREYTTRGGMYDVVCPECGGKRVVRDECACADCYADREEEAMFAAEAAAERRMGC